MLLAMVLMHSYSDLVDELTDAAVVMAGEIGAPHLSVRALAARVAITPQALLNRWTSKDRIPDGRADVGRLRRDTPSAR